jgi:hypothetical protein
MVSWPRDSRIPPAGGGPPGRVPSELTGFILRLTILGAAGGVRFASGPKGTQDLIARRMGRTDDPRPLRMDATFASRCDSTSTPNRRRPPQIGDLYSTRWTGKGAGCFDMIISERPTHPAAHVQINGALVEDCLLPRVALPGSLPTGGYQASSVSWPISSWCPPGRQIWRRSSTD